MIQPLASYMEAEERRRAQQPRVDDAHKSAWPTLNFFKLVSDRLIATSTPTIGKVAWNSEHFRFFFR
jgi:hypothetical protein